MRDVWSDSHVIHHSWWPLVECDLSKSQFNIWHHAVPLNYFWVMNDRFYILELMKSLQYIWIMPLYKTQFLGNLNAGSAFRLLLAESSWKPEKVQRIKLSFGKTFKMKNIQVVSPSILNCLCKLGYWQVMHTRMCQWLWEFLFSLFSSVVNFLCRYPSL